MEVCTFSQLLDLCAKASLTNHILSFATTWWFIWFARNKLIFNNESLSFRKLSILIVNYDINLSKANSNGLSDSGSLVRRPAPSEGSRSRSGQNVIWSPPLEGYFKLNFDDSELVNGNASIGFVIRND